MAWRQENIELGRVSSSGSRSRDAREYLARHGMAFIQDIVQGTDLSSSQVCEQVDVLAKTPWEAVVAVPWPAVAPITTFYYVRREHETQELERWANRTVDFVNGVTPGVPVLISAAAYAAHVGHVGRAIAGLMIAREAGALSEVAVPDRCHVGFSPAYVLPSAAYLLRNPQ